MANNLAMRESIVSPLVVLGGNPGKPKTVTQVAPENRMALQLVHIRCHTAFTPGMKLASSQIANSAYSDEARKPERFCNQSPT